MGYSGGMKFVRVRRDFVHALLSIVLGALVFAGLSFAQVKPLHSLLAAWDAGAALYLAIFCLVLAPLSAKATQARAAAEDPGRAAVSALVVLGSAASLLSAVVVTAASRGQHRSTLVALSLANVALSWSLTHAAFALRYAHLYYRDDGEPIGGVDFPGGKPPDYADFAYLAFTVGMTFQVSDTTVSDAQIRRTLLLQALLSFLYNTAILALVLNLVFGLA
jgi:uncharacterized membrane protein